MVVPTNAAVWHVYEESGFDGCEFADVACSWVSVVYYTLYIRGF